MSTGSSVFGFLKPALSADTRVTKHAQSVCNVTNLIWAQGRRLMHAEFKLVGDYGLSAPVKDLGEVKTSRAAIAHRARLLFV